MNVKNNWVGLGGGVIPRVIDFFHSTVVFVCVEHTLCISCFSYSSCISIFTRGHTGTVPESTTTPPCSITSGPSVSDTRRPSRVRGHRFDGMGKPVSLTQVRRARFATCLQSQIARKLVVLGDGACGKVYGLPQSLLTRTDISADRLHQRYASWTMGGIRSDEPKATFQRHSESFGRVLAVFLTL